MHYNYEKKTHTGIIIVLQVESGLVAAANGDNGVLQQTLSQVEATLNVLADSVLQEQPLLRRKKLEHLVGWTVIILALNWSTLILDILGMCLQEYEFSKPLTHIQKKSLIASIVLEEKVCPWENEYLRQRG